MPKVLAERLSAEIEKKGWTQEKLAEMVGISREQCGKHLRKNGVFRINEATAKGYETAFNLSREELSKPAKVDKQSPSGWNRVVFQMSDEELLNLKLTEMRYGVDIRSILRMSTQNFLIVAELQLADRAKRLAEAENQIRNFPAGLDHMADVVHGKARIEEALWAEKRSITARDLTGATFYDEEWYDGFSGNADLFEAFLEQMLEELVPDLYESRGGSQAFDLFQEQIKELTQGDRLAQMVLLKGDVHPRELAAIPPEGRVAFLHERCSKATLEAHEAREALYANFDLLFDEVPVGGQANA